MKAESFVIICSGVTTPGQLWAMPGLPFGLPRLPCPQIDETFYVTLMLLASCPGCPGCPFTLVTPLIKCVATCTYKLLLRIPKPIKASRAIIYPIIFIFNISVNNCSTSIYLFVVSIVCDLCPMIPIQTTDCYWT